MLEGAVYCAAVVVWIFIGAAKTEDRAGSMALTFVGTLLALRCLGLVIIAFAQRSALLN